MDGHVEIDAGWLLSQLLLLFSQTHLENKDAHTSPSHDSNQPHTTLLELLPQPTPNRRARASKRTPRRRSRTVEPHVRPLHGEAAAGHLAPVGGELGVPLVPALILELPLGAAGAAGAPAADGPGEGQAEDDGADGAEDADLGGGRELVEFLVDRFGGTGEDLLGDGGLTSKLTEMISMGVTRRERSSEK